MIERKTPPKYIVGRNRPSKYDALCHAALSSPEEWVVETEAGPDSSRANTVTKIRGTLLKHLYTVEVRFHDDDVYLRVAPKEPI